MTKFTYKFLAFICLLVLTGFVTMTSSEALASSGAGRGTTGTSATGGIQSSASGIIDTTKGYASQASDLLGSVNQAGSAVGGLANSFGVGGDVLSTGTNILGSAGSYLSQGQGALDIMGNLSNLDMNSLTSGLGGVGSMGLGALGGNLGKSAQTIIDNAGKYFDSGLGVNLDSIWGKVTNLQQDLTGTIKQFVAGELSTKDITSLASGLTGGTPVTYVDLGPVGVATVVFEGQIPIAMGSQYAALTDYSAALGPVGNMDFRNGQCVHNGHDYTGMLQDYINGAGVANEGEHMSLYLDTNCWITVGIGSLMAQYTSSRNWAGYKAYFDSMEYVDKAGNPVDQATKDADLKIMYELEGQCRAECGCSAAADAALCTGGTTKDKDGRRVQCCSNTKVRGKDGLTYCWNKPYSFYANKVGNRKISSQAAGDAIFNELCNSHIPPLVNKSGGAFPKFNIKLQEVLLDISYQGGAGSMGDLMTRLKSGNCGTAVSSFSSSRLCTDYKNRCAWRLGALTSGCNMGVYAN